jgi:hypothetical protein
MRRVLLVLSAAVLGCTEGPYRDLTEAYRVETPSTVPPIKSQTVVFVSPKHRGAFNLQNVVDIRLSDTFLEIDPSIPTMSTVRIPTTEIFGCSKTCFGEGRWDVDVLVPRTQTEISIPQAQEVVEWCWANRLPMISAEHRRNWLYNGAGFPSRADYEGQLASRERFDTQARQSCLGY